MSYDANKNETNIQDKENESLFLIAKKFNQEIKLCILKIIEECMKNKNVIFEKDIINIIICGISHNIIDLLECYKNLPNFDFKKAVSEVSIRLYDVTMLLASVEEGDISMEEAIECVGQKRKSSENEKQ